MTAGKIESEAGGVGDNLIFLMIGRLSESWEKLSDVWDLNAQAVSAYVMILKANAVIDLNIHPNVLNVDLSNQQHIREAASEVLNHFQELPPQKKNSRLILSVLRCLRISLLRLISLCFIASARLLLPLRRTESYLFFTERLRSFRSRLLLPFAPTHPSQVKCRILK